MPDTSWTTRTSLRKSPTKPGAPSSASVLGVSGSGEEDTIGQLFVHRHGDVPHSNMTTISLERLIDPAVLYEFDRDRGITVASNTLQTLNPSTTRCFESRNTPPPSLAYATFVGCWDDTPGPADFTTNILGGND